MLCTIFLKRTTRPCTAWKLQNCLCSVNSHMTYHYYGAPVFIKYLCDTGMQYHSDVSYVLEFFFVASMYMPVRCLCEKSFSFAICTAFEKPARCPTRWIARLAWNDNSSNGSNTNLHDALNLTGNPSLVILPLFDFRPSPTLPHLSRRKAKATRFLHAYTHHAQDRRKKNSSECPNHEVSYSSLSTAKELFCKE